eukprot:COSAG02_NODE_311_length_24966_cov_1089.426187_11_plen_195_part_00
MSRGYNKRPHFVPNSRPWPRSQGPSWALFSCLWGGRMPLLRIFREHPGAGAAVRDCERRAIDEFEICAARRRARANAGTLVPGGCVTRVHRSVCASSTTTYCMTAGATTLRPAHLSTPLLQRSSFLLCVVSIFLHDWAALGAPADHPARGQVGRWTAEPALPPLPSFSDGPFAGNGDLGLTWGGPPELSTYQLD